MRGGEKKQAKTAAGGSQRPSRGAREGGRRRGGKEGEQEGSNKVELVA